MKKYLLNVIFCMNEDKEDIDRDLFLLCTNKEITESEMNDIFNEANKSIFYEENNINTLMERVGDYTNGKVIEIYSNCGYFKIDNYYMIKID